jgi:hypothetical protein
VWLGRQAIDLGLSGRVDGDDLRMLLEGRDPASGTPLGNLLVDRTLANGKVVRAVAGCDATFSAPKSVSVGWALTGDLGLLEPGFLEQHRAENPAPNNQAHDGRTPRPRNAPERAARIIGALRIGDRGGCGCQREGGCRSLV